MEGDPEILEALDEVKAVTELQRALLLTALGLSSLIYGSTVDPSDFTRRIKKPKGMWMSMVVSVLLSPLLAYILTLAMRLGVTDGIALLVTSCCPAGTLSPIFAYYTQADVCLCLCVIVLSTLMSVGMIPLGVYITSSAYTELDLTVIPNNDIVVDLCVSMGSIAVGMAFRQYKEKRADRIAKGFSYMPMLVTLAMIIIVGVRLPHSLNASVKEILAVFLYLVIVLIGAYLLGLLMDQDHEVCRAMAFCSANKSVMLALAIVHVSFSGTVLLETLPVPTLFLIEYMAIGLLLSAIFQIYGYYNFTAFTELLENLRETTPV